jgi:hypothetical protein
MTVARDRWQQHLKSGGEHFRRAARAVTDLPERVGGPAAALALDCLAAVLEACRVGRLTRSQHVLLRLGELITYAECAASLARRADAAARGALPEKADRRFDADALAAISRVFAREAVMKVAEEGARWIAAAAPTGGAPATVDPAAALPLAAAHAAQAGLLADMDLVADALYARVTS